MSLFQSNLRKRIRKLPKNLKFVKIIHYYLLLFIRVLTYHGRKPRATGENTERGQHVEFHAQALQRDPD